MEQKDFLELAAKVADGKASDEELNLYAAVYEHFQQGAASSWNADEYGDEKRLASLLDRRLRPVHPNRYRPPIAAAAVILLLIAIGGYFLSDRFLLRSSHPMTLKDDVAPGHNRATLILANGKKVILNQHLNGQIALQGQTRINARDGQLVYQSETDEQEIGYNTLTTSRGEQSPYPIVLADGTKIWLNAQSSLTFPVAFNNKERIIKLSGEAYFEVKHNAIHPFKVYTAGGIIEDIGTHFNIKAYPDKKQESTTLLQGAVKITTQAASKLLNPGEQANYKQGNILIKKVDAEEAIAWKNGYFMFSDQTLVDVMEEISRWYDVEVEFEDESLKQLTFVASITKYTNMSKVLQVLEMTKQVHFNVKDRLIKVYPNRLN